MKSIRVLIITAAHLLTWQAMAQFAVDWFALDSGGSPSQGGRFSLHGAIGQAVAAPAISGGNFSVEGAFASLFPIQVDLPPLLSIRLGSANTVVFSWSVASSGFILQETTNLAQTNLVATPGPFPTTVPAPDISNSVGWQPILSAIQAIRTRDVFRAAGGLRARDSLRSMRSSTAVAERY